MSACMQDAARCAATLVGDGKEEVLGGDELVVEAVGLFGRALQHTVGAEGDIACGACPGRMSRSWHLR